MKTIQQLSVILLGIIAITSGQAAANKTKPSRAGVLANRDQPRQKRRIAQSDEPSHYYQCVLYRSKADDKHAGAIQTFARATLPTPLRGEDYTHVVFYSRQEVFEAHLYQNGNFVMSGKADDRAKYQRVAEQTVTLPSNPEDGYPEIKGQFQFKPTGSAQTLNYHLTCK